MSGELLTLDQVQEKVDVKDYKSSKPIDFASKKNRIEHDGEDYILAMGGKERRITPGGIYNMMRSMKLPPALPKRLQAHPDLVANLVSEYADRQAISLRSLSRGKSIVSFVDTDHTLVSNTQILEGVRNAFGEPLFSHVNTHDDGKASFNIVSEEKKKLIVGKDDSFLGGVRIENNPLASSTTRIESYLSRLVCLNGQISTRAHWSAPRQIEDDASNWIKMNIGHARVESEKMFDSIARLADKKIDANMMDFIENMYEQLKVPEKVRDLITRRVVKEGAETLYDLFNHITYVASNYKSVRQDPELSARLMRIGGHFAEHIEDSCSSCSRPVLLAVAD